LNFEAVAGDAAAGMDDDFGSYEGPPTGAYPKREKPKPASKPFNEPGDHRPKPCFKR
jgi:hypothetical protein